MNMTEQIRIILVRRGNMSEAELARRISTSPQNLHNKFVRNNFTIKDLEQIATALDCELQINFRDKETNSIL